MWGWPLKTNDRKGLSALENFKKDFPLLVDSDIAYLDNAATEQRPRQVLEAEREFYNKYNANPLRGLYALAMEATERYEAARVRVQRFVNAAKPEEIIFTRNTTESINLVAYSYALSTLKPGDEILISIAEHHSNMLPWQMAARQTGATLKYLECGPDGSFPEAEVVAAVTTNTKIAAVGHISNVLGKVMPVEALIQAVHAVGGVVLLDAAQSAPHVPIDVQKLDVDFLAFSGHKLMAPMGIGVLYGKKALLEAMPPFLTGGEMIESVTREGATYAPLPHKFEAGTVNGGGAVALAAAIDYLESVGMETIHERELQLTRYTLDGMKNMPCIHVQGSGRAEDHCGIISFTIDGVHPHDIATILDADGIAIRAGHHCAQPLLKHLGVMSTARVSLAFYNTEEDVDRFLKAVCRVRREMGYGE